MSQAKNGTGCLLHLSSQSLVLRPNLELWAKYLKHEFRKQQNWAPLLASLSVSVSQY